MKSCENCKWNDYEGITEGYWQRLIRGSESRKIRFDLSPEDAWTKFIEQGGKCALSGDELVFARGYTRQQTASLDRVDPKGDYTKENIQWVHKELNLMKNRWSNSEFISWCRKVTENLCPSSS